MRFPTKRLHEMIIFSNGKSIKPGGEGTYPVYGSNGIIGYCDQPRENNGVIIGRVGAYCGSVAYCPGRFWASDNTIVAYTKNDGDDIRFLYYLLKDLNLNRWAGGAAQPLMTQTVLNQVEAVSPPASIQHKIAAILSAYDDLIENNLRRIKILEEMAQILYREWFVKFRFPGRQKVKMVDSPLGKIPEVWEKCKFADMCDVTDYVANGSFASLKANVTYCDKPDYAVLVRTKDLNDGWNGKYVYVTEPSYKFLKKSSLNPGDIVIGNVGNVGTVFRVPDLKKPMTIGPNAVLVRPAKHTEYFFRFLQSPFGQSLLKSITSGVAQPKFNKTDLRNLEIYLPPEKLREDFAVFLSPIDQLSESIRQRNSILRQTRDFLLPKLISGELDVSELDITISEANA